MVSTRADERAAVTQTEHGQAEQVEELEPLPKKLVLGLAIGHGGMSILINLLGILLVFFYLPPDSEGLPQLVTDRTFLLVLNAVVLIAAAGRLTDAITDPLIAIFSDKSKHRLGRRIPFMTYAAVPAALLTLLMFVPPSSDAGTTNILWLLGIQVLLYFFLTAYVTPAFSLVADLGRTPAERLDLATWTSVAWAIGIVIAAMVTFLPSLFQGSGMSIVNSYQTSVALVCAVAAIAMLVPRFTIDEPRYARSEPSTLSPRETMNVVLSNQFFRYYLAADFAYFCGLMIIQTGLLYYVSVLLELEEALSAALLLLMVVVSMVLYPIVNAQAKKRSGKQLVIFAFVISAIDFFGVVFLGKYPIPNIVEAILLISLFAVPFAILSVLPGWILTDIAEHSANETGTATAGMFFAARTFMQKISQTVGVMLFALLTSFGRDIGDDLGIRLSGLAGVALYGLAAFLFRNYDEDKLRSDLAAARA